MSIEAGKSHDPDSSKPDITSVPDTVYEGFGGESTKVPAQEKAEWDQARADVRDSFTDATPASPESDEDKKSLLDFFRTTTGKVIGVTATALAAGVVIYGATHRSQTLAPERVTFGQDAEPGQEPAPQASENVDGPIVPPVAPTSETPVATQEISGVAAEKQNSLYKSVDLPISSLFSLKEYKMNTINPSVLNLYEGAKEKTGLFPGYKDELEKHSILASELTPEDIADLQTRHNTLLDASYTIIDSDGKPQEVDAVQFWEGTLAFSGSNQKVIEKFIDPNASPEVNAHSVAGNFITNDGDAIDHFINQKAKLDKYNKTHPDQEPVAISNPYIDALTVAQRSYVDPKLQNSYIEQRVTNAKKEGDFTANGTASIVETYEIPFISADGSVRTTLRAVTVIFEQGGANGTGKLVMETSAIFPIDKEIKNDPVTMTSKMEDTKGKGVYSTAVISRSVVEAK